MAKTKAFISIKNKTVRIGWARKEKKSKYDEAIET